jgi:hypothetical protein
MGDYHPAPESKAVPKATGARVQEITIADGQTVPSTYFTKEGRDLVAVHVDSAFDGTKLYFEVSYDGGTTWLDHAWGSNNPHEETLTESVGIDPAIFAGCPLIRPYSDAAQSGAACVVTGIFRDFRA